MRVIVMMTGFVGVVMGGFGEVAVFEDVYFGRRDAAAVYRFNFESSVEVEHGNCLVKNACGNSGRKQRAEKHIAGDACKAVEISNAHKVGLVYSMLRDACAVKWKRL